MRKLEKCTPYFTPILYVDYKHMSDLLSISLSPSVPQRANFQTDAQEIYQNFNSICYSRTQRSVKRKKTRGPKKLKEI